eukprot:TRINITY_DN10026_c0_g1_i1.p1 TRINITY_DN10026_c0_g1~~TRINITY_DN10026_c0_g1_i1.p1  ORF type:complete len:342 (-),score=46.13 TRINITY_DN10026_c0_g1_i1:100-1125(-)
MTLGMFQMPYSQSNFVISAVILLIGLCVLIGEAVCRLLASQAKVFWLMFGGPLTAYCLTVVALAQMRASAPVAAAGPDAAAPNKKWLGGHSVSKVILLVSLYVLALLSILLPYASIVGKSVSMPLISITCAPNTTLPTVNAVLPCNDNEFTFNMSPNPYLMAGVAPGYLQIDGLSPSLPAGVTTRAFQFQLNAACTPARAGGIPISVSPSRVQIQVTANLPTCTKDTMTSAAVSDANWSLALVVLCGCVAYCCVISLIAALRESGKKAVLMFVGMMLCTLAYAALSIGVSWVLLPSSEYVGLWLPLGAIAATVIAFLYFHCRKLGGGSYNTMGGVGGVCTV